MKQLTQLLIIAMVALVHPVWAQDAGTVIKEGISLSNSGNHAAALEKYKSVLAAEPENASANYQMAFTLNALGKGNEAIPFLQKVVAQKQGSPQILSGAYGLMGGIYDKAGQAKLAINSYQQALKIDGQDAGLHYSLGLAYFRDRQYADAENSAISALSYNSKHAGSMRLYALVTFHQNKRAPALLALCSFLYMEPNGVHAAEAYSNLQSILKGGVLKTERGIAPLDADNAALNKAITQAVADVAKRKYVMAIDELTEQLTAIFGVIGKLGANQNKSDFFKAMAARYQQLGQSGHMPAFARYIRQNTDKAAAGWIAQHPQQMTELKDWLNVH